MWKYVDELSCEVNLKELPKQLEELDYEQRTMAADFIEAAIELIKGAKKDLQTDDGETTNIRLEDLTNLIDTAGDFLETLQG